MSDKKNFLGRLALFMTAIIWGASFVVLKSAITEAGTLWVLAIRFVFSALLFCAIANRSLLRMGRRIFWGSVLMGACIGVAFIVQTYGLYYTTPGKNAFLTATYCVLVPFLSWICFKKKPGMSNALAAILCIAGIGFISLGGESGSLNKGDLLTLGCGVFYAVQIILMGRYSGECGALPISAVQFSTAGVICLICALIFEPMPAYISPGTWLSIGYLSLFCTAIAFFLQAWGMKYTPAPVAAVLMTLEAMFGALISVLFYGEKMTGKLAAGFLLVFLSVVISETDPKFLRSRAIDSVKE